MGSEKTKLTDKTREVKSWIMAARAYMQKKSNTEAEDVLREATSQMPDSLEAWTELCILLLSLRRETDAELSGKQILRLRKEKSLTWAQLRSELREKYVGKKQVADISEKVTEYQEESSMYPSRVESPRHEVREGLMTEPEDDAVEEFEKHNARKGELRKSEKAEPKTADNWYEFAKLYQKQEKYPDALRALQKTLELDPGKIDAQVRIGEVYIKQTNYTEAILWLNHVVAKNTDDAHAWFLLGVAHLELGKYWDASKALYEAVKIDDDYIDAWKKLGISLAKQDRHGQAQKAFLRALKDNRKDPDLLYQYALSLRGEGELSRAENVLRMAISYRKDFAEAWRDLGDILIALGKSEEGTRAKRKARALKQG